MPAIKFRQGTGQRSAAGALRQLNYFFPAMMNGIGERLLDDGFEQHRRLVFVEQYELGINVRLNRKLMQQARTESVNRGNDRTFECAFVT